ncbi:DoxX family protein [Streptomyces sp. R41]|uniref:DoxX family protein n=1 Tax=Streptomyces sp. R41 TaxID=3238632 RepID=A0AB39S1L2_9ACTN
MPTRRTCCGSRTRPARRCSSRARLRTTSGHPRSAARADLLRPGHGQGPGPAADARAGAEVGFSTAAYRRTGGLEVAGAVGLLIGLIEPLIGTLAGAGLLLLLAGALVVHLRKGDGPRKLAPTVFCGLLFFAYLIVHMGATR